MRFLVFVEGKTEEEALRTFFKRWLDSRLPFRIGINMVSFEGSPHYIEGIGKKVHLDLSGKTGTDIIAGIGLLDLYGSGFYPDHMRDVKERYSWAKKHLEDKVDHPRFRQHFAVHETEAWLLAQPEIFPREALPGKSSHPETVNFDEPPAKLLTRLYRDKLGRKYKKVIDGTNLFRNLSPDRAYEKCPYLKALLDDMLSLAQAALG